MIGMKKAGKESYHDLVGADLLNLIRKSLKNCMKPLLKINHAI